MLKFDAATFQKKVRQTAVNAITKRLKTIRCPVHGQLATVTMKGSSDKPEWEISACCGDLKELVRAALKK